MFDPIINFFNSLWEIFVSFIQLILGWLLDVIMSCFSLLLIVIKFMFWQTLDFAIGLFSPWFLAILDLIPDINPWTPNIIGYLSTLNQIFPVTELFYCLTFLFGFWLVQWCVKTIKAFIPTE